MNLRMSFLQRGDVISLTAFIFFWVKSDACLIQYMSQKKYFLLSPLTFIRGYGESSLTYFSKDAVNMYWVVFPSLAVY